LTPAGVEIIMLPEVFMSRILLVKCSQHEGVLSVFTFPLGLMHLASALRHDSDKHEIEIYDLRIRDQDYSRLRETAARFKPDIVGLSAITMEVPSLNFSARTLREAGFDGPIIAGGPHPTHFPEDSLAGNDIDYLVLGEGEETFKELVEQLSAGKDPRGVPGIAYRENGHVKRSAARPPIQDLDQLPLPAWDLVDVGEYSSFKSMSGLRRGVYANLFTSRACPFRCTYCHSIFGKGFRARSAESVLAEVKMLVDEYGVECLEIVDDIFNCDLERAKKIFDLLYHEGIRTDIAFPNGLRCDRLDREFLEKLRRFPASLVCVPVESASERIQKLIKKNLNLSRVNEIIDICADLRIYTRGYFMLGFPTETRDEIRATVDYAVNSKLHSALFFIVIPFKGTELYDMCMQHKKAGDLRFEDHDYFRSPLNLSQAPDRDLFRMQRWAYARLAMHPARIYRLFRDFPDYRLIWTGIKTWAGLFWGAGKGLKPGRPDLVPGATKPGL
jgi:anaerobic magnesium-protoporphyrin IX monomethyl ester cyclase